MNRLKCLKRDLVRSVMGSCHETPSFFVTRVFNRLIEARSFQHLGKAISCFNVSSRQRVGALKGANQMEHLSSLHCLISNGDG